MKKYLCATIMFCLLVALCACGSKKNALAEDVFLRVSVTAKGEDVETAEMYTLNAELHQDGTVRIYADNFNRWLSSEEIPEETITLSADVMQEIRDIIDEIDLYHMRENIGSRDLTEGEYKELTVYTTDGEHTSGGLNPSNRSFLKLYDYVKEQTRETDYQYRSRITELQNKGREARQNSGISIMDTKDQPVIAKEEINDVYVTYGEKHLRYDQTASADAEPEVSYYVTLLLSDAAALAMQEATTACTEDNALYYKLYENESYAFTFGVWAQVVGGELYVYETDDAEEAVSKAQQFRSDLYAE